MSTRSKSFLVQKFVKQAVGPRFKTVIQGLRWKVIKCQRFVRSYLVCNQARLKLLKRAMERQVKIRCDEIHDQVKEKTKIFSS